MTQERARILMVEDSEADAERVRLSFDAWRERFELEVVGSLGEARESLRVRPPALVLVDLILPDGRGVALLPESPAERAFPVVVMTGHGDESVAVEVMKAGAAAATPPANRRLKRPVTKAGATVVISDAA